MTQATLYRARTGEGLRFLHVGVDLVVLVAVLSAAYVLSCCAHGAGRRAPRSVRRVRAAAVVGLTGALVVGFSVAGGVGPETCFRSCAPFPR